MVDLAQMLAACVAAADPVILIEVAAARGSTPREAGAAMLVTATATHGTIGGGQLEFHATDVARGMLASAEIARRLALPLGPHLGQCCGGHVSLSLRRAGPAEISVLLAREAAEAASRPTVLILGAGHTGRALARALAPLPLATRLIDDREGVLDDLPEAIRRERLDDPAEAIAAAPSGAAYVILSHSHALDYRLAEAALLRPDAAYVGLIGSATKRARFESAFRARHADATPLARLVCPLGGSYVADKRPEVIAALTAAELLRACLPAPPAPSLAGRDEPPRGA